MAGVAFGEPDAGSDLSAMGTRIRDDGDTVVVDGHKVWVTGAAYADLLVVFGRSGGAVMPFSTPGRLDDHRRRSSGDGPLTCSWRPHTVLRKALS
jgi:alkylation response protein AidB-like acyl-CoA dehydrogenase